MEISLDKALKTVATLALCVIAVQIIPISRNYELKNLCVEADGLFNSDGLKNQKKKSDRIRKEIAQKAGIENKDSVLEIYCNNLFQMGNDKYGFPIFNIL